jgi:hypothetical protein
MNVYLLLNIYIYNFECHKFMCGPQHLKIVSLGPEEIEVGHPWCKLCKLDCNALHNLVNKLLHLNYTEQ